MGVRVKICGVREPASMRACVEAGADFIGLNFAPGSRRSVDVDEGRQLASMVEPHGPKLVGVFCNTPIELVLRIADRVGVDWLQLHGDETPEECALAAEHYPVIKALAFDQFARRAATFEGACAHLLVDARKPGSGTTWDYEMVRSFPGGGDRLFLAGGLDVHNVAEAVARAAPFAVDTASGVERDGSPDPMRVIRFIDAVRAAPLLHPKADACA